MISRGILFVLTLLLSGSFAAGQEAEDRTLLPWPLMRAIINEASGERAMHHVLELVPYPRVRPRTEYEGHFRESEVMAKFAREYGYSNVEIESFPTGQRLWQPTQGELWMVEPQMRKLHDIYDVAVSLAANSANGDVTAELVDVGVGSRPEDYAGKDVTGKIVLGSAGTGQLQQQGVFQRGAVGVVSYNSLRPDDYPDEIPSSSVSANPPAGANREALQAAGAAMSRIPQHMRAELQVLVGQKKTVLEIRDFLSGEFEPLPLADVMDLFTAQEKAGQVKLVPLPPPPPPKKK